MIHTIWVSLYSSLGLHYRLPIIFHPIFVIELIPTHRTVPLKSKSSIFLCENFKTRLQFAKYSLFTTKKIVNTKLNSYTLRSFLKIKLHSFPFKFLIKTKIINWKLFLWYSNKSNHLKQMISNICIKIVITTHISNFPRIQRWICWENKNRFNNFIPLPKVDIAVLEKKNNSCW